MLTSKGDSSELFRAERETFFPESVRWERPRSSTEKEVVDMADLASRKCESCAPGTPPKTEEEAKELLEQLDVGWGIEDGEIRREIKLSNFRDAFGLATRIGMVAEAEGHHPDLEIGYGRLGISMSTHSIGGLSDNDFILAAKIDRLINPVT